MSQPYTKPQASVFINNDMGWPTVKRKGSLCEVLKFYGGSNLLALCLVRSELPVQT